MEYVEATDRLAKIGISLADLAEEMGASYGLLRQARLDPESDSYRQPPDGWREAATRLARRRGKAALKLVDALEGERG